MTKYTRNTAKKKYVVSSDNVNPDTADYNVNLITDDDVTKFAKELTKKGVIDMTLNEDTILTKMEEIPVALLAISNELAVIKKELARVMRELTYRSALHTNKLSSSPEDYNAPERLTEATKSAIIAVQPDILALADAKDELRYRESATKALADTYNTIITMVKAYVDLTKVEYFNN